MAGSNTQQACRAEACRAVNCMICHQRLCKPKLLPCMHSCCEECLREFVVSRLYDTIGSFPCPLCGQTTCLPPTGVGGFPNRLNFVASPNSAAVREAPIPLWGSDLILSFGCYGTGTADLTQPVGLAVKGNREIVVTDRSTNRILTYSLQGEVKSVFACRHSIAGVAVTPRDTVVVASADIKQPLAIEYDNRTGARLRSFGHFNCLETTNGIAVVSSPFAVVVSSFETGTVHFLSESGRLVRKFSRRAVTGQAYHLCGNSRGDVVVSDYANNRVVVIDRVTGKCVVKMGGIGNAAGLLYQPLGVCVDVDDNIIVADSGNQRVVLYSASGTYCGMVVDMSMSMGKPCNVACVPGAAMLIVLVTGRNYAQIRVYSYNPDTLCESSNCGMEQPASITSHVSLPWQALQVRNRYVNKWMRRDVKRRQLVKEHAVARLRVNAVRRNTIIPQEIQEIAYREINAFPIDSCRTRISSRCVLTSRPRGLVHPWHLSRIMWRLLADYNKMSGVIRAKW